MGSKRPCTVVPSPQQKDTLSGQLDHRHIARPLQRGGQRLQMVGPGEIAKVRQHVEDPVVLHDTLLGIG
jgi:hypothetical protein